MPNIKTYESQVTGFRPTETGVEATAQAGRRAGTAYAEASNSVRQTAASLQRVGQETREFGSETAAAGNQFATNLEQGINYTGKVAVDMLDHQQISQGAVAYTKMMSRMTDAWNDTAKNADPNDPTVGPNFREKILEPELETFRNSFLTDKSQQWAEHRVENLRNHMTEKTTADMAMMAGRAAELNVHTMSNTMSTTAMRDPSAVPQLLKDVDATIGGMIDSSPNLKGPEAAKLRMTLLQQAKENIVKYGAIGAIQSSGNPEAALEAWMNKYGDSGFVNGAELKMLAANARTNIRAQRQDQMWNDHQKKIAEQDASDKAEVSTLQKLYSDDPNVAASVSSRAVVNDPTLNRMAKERLINVVRREMKPETDSRISNATFVDLANGIRSGEITDLGPVMAARTKGAGEEGSLNRSDFNEARQMFVDHQSPEGSKRGAATHKFIVGASENFKDLLGRVDTQSAYEFNHFVDSKVDEYIKAKRNIYDLFDPGKPDYLGKRETLQPFIKSFTERVQDRTRSLSSPTPTAPAPGQPRTPGLQPLPQSEPVKPGSTTKVDLGNPPLKGAQWDDKLNSWIIIDGSRKFRVGP